MITDELKVTRSHHNYFVNIPPLFKINYNKVFLPGTDKQQYPTQVLTKT